MPESLTEPSPLYHHSHDGCGEVVRKPYCSLRFIVFSLVIISSLYISGCSSSLTSREYPGDYDFTRPDVVSVMPDTLHEVSGISFIDSTVFACVQDENGILFMYDASGNKIIRQYTFHIDGDYEGIARAEETMYILRSDGTLFEIAHFSSEKFVLHQYITGIPADNNEGLCYDPDGKRLLIACKGKIGKGPGYKDKRVIYGFDIQKKTLSEKPVFEFDLKKIREFAIANKLDLPSKKRKKKGQTVTEPLIKFRTSAICIHPLTKKLYLLSASDHLLFIFSMNGDLEKMEPLDPEIFNKPEGIAFFNNGDMLITNEGQDHKPTLVLLRYLSGPPPAHKKSGK